MEFIAKQIPYVLPWDKMPVDISFIFENEKPAGKHGFLKIEGENFVFEDGTPAKFWGTNFNSGANFPSHSHSEKVAKRLAQAGLNMVRFHQLEADFSTPNIFQFTKGKRLDNTSTFDPESMDRLDYLVHCLKQEGIYVYFDCLCYRRFRTGDGVENALYMQDAAKPNGYFDRNLIALQKDFAKKFLEHVNPYTGLAYKDDPVIAMAEVVNECSLFNPGKFTTYEPFNTELFELYRDFCAKKGIEVKFEEWEFSKKTPLLREFIMETEMAYYREMISYLRGIGAKFPINGTNWPIDKATPYNNAMASDFTDNHFYYCDWSQVDQRKFRNKSMMTEDDTIAYNLVGHAVENLPMFISEWDAPWPNAYRADATLFLAAIGALQNWAGWTIHTYRYGTNEDPAITGKIGRSIVIGNSYYRGIFDTYNDPAKFGLFQHAALITRRGDVKQAEKTVYQNINVEDLYDPDYKVPYMQASVEQSKLRYRYNGKTEGEFAEVKDDVLSDTKEIYRNWKKGYGWIDAGRTKAVYGFIGDEDFQLTDVSIKAKNNYATIAISSLTDEDITNSNNLFITAVGKADNTDSVYNNDHTTLLKEGKAPILIEVIEAEIAIKTPYKNMRVWSVDPEGYYTGLMPTTYEDGVLKFTIGKEFESMYYLVQEQ